MLWKVTLEMNELLSSMWSSASLHCRRMLTLDNLSFGVALRGFDGHYYSLRDTAANDVLLFKESTPFNWIWNTSMIPLDSQILPL